MAIIDPSIAKHIFAPPFELDIHELDPKEMEPIGDRYIVEELAVNEKVLFGSLLVVTNAPPSPDDDPRNPQANPNVERRGVMAAVVISKGNGHLLGLPDPRIAVSAASGASKIERTSADVPMFLEHGDVVLVDKNMKGRALQIAGRLLRVVSQIDCLVKLKVRLKFKDGKWERL